MGKKYKFFSGMLFFLGLGCFGAFVALGDVTYEVVFDSDGGSLVQTQTVNKNAKVLKPNDPIKEGYLFTGWMLDDNNYDFEYNVTSNITLKASWREAYKIKITLDEEVYTYEYSLGEKINLSDFHIPVKDGYKIVLFVQEENLDIEDAKEYNLETEITGSLNLVGEYRELKMVVITFDSDGGSKIDGLSVLEGTIIDEPKTTKENCTFLGWFKGDKKYDFKQPVLDDMTLVASWKDGNKVSVNFYVDDKKYDTILVSIGEKVTKPADPIKDGYIFEGWKHNGKMFDFETIIEKDLTLTANFHEAKIFKVTFNTDDGTYVPGQNILENGKVQRPPNPTKEGYRFVEWTYENKTYDFEKTVTQHMTLKAKWEEITSYVVSFDTDGGGIINNQYVKAGLTCTKPDDPTKTGFVFDGWQLNGVPYDFSKAVTSDIKLIAKWRSS